MMSLLIKLHPMCFLSYAKSQVSIVELIDLCWMIKVHLQFFQVFYYLIDLVRFTRLVKELERHDEQLSTLNNELRRLVMPPMDIVRAPQSGPRQKYGCYRQPVILAQTIVGFPWCWTSPVAELNVQLSPHIRGYYVAVSSTSVQIWCETSPFEFYLW